MPIEGSDPWFGGFAVLSGTTEYVQFWPLSALLELHSVGLLLVNPPSGYDTTDNDQQ